jgi:hypothetical protein
MLAAVVAAFMQREEHPEQEVPVAEGLDVLTQQTVLLVQ